MGVDMRPKSEHRTTRLVERTEGGKEKVFIQQHRYPSLVRKIRRLPYEITVSVSTSIIYNNAININL